MIKRIMAAAIAGAFLSVSAFAASIPTTIQATVPPVSNAWYNFYVDGSYIASSPPYQVTMPNGNHSLTIKEFTGNHDLLGESVTNIGPSVTAPGPIDAPSLRTTFSVTVPQPSSGWDNFYVDGAYAMSSPPLTFTIPTGPHTVSIINYSGNHTVIATSFFKVLPAGSAAPTPTPTPTTISIPGVTGSPSNMSGSPDINPADYGKYNAPGGSADGYNLIGGPLLDDVTAASFVKTTQMSTVETGQKDGALVATENANANNYFAYEARNNPNDYVSQLSGFYSEWTSGAWGGAVARIDGGCPIANPTTAEAAQWAANKWGVNPLLVYAEAVQEGDWNQASLGDNGTSSGVWQVADRNYPQHAFPGFQGAGQNLARENTCFNADFYAAHLWAAFHGFTGECQAGNIGTAIQTWYQGTASAPGTYTTSVYNHLTNQDWIPLYFDDQFVPY